MKRNEMKRRRNNAHGMEQKCVRSKSLSAFAFLLALVYFARFFSESLLEPSFEWQFLLIFFALLCIYHIIGCIRKVDDDVSARIFRVDDDLRVRYMQDASEISGWFFPLPIHFQGLRETISTPPKTDSTKSNFLLRN